MCGICGELGPRPAARDRLAAMTAAVRHRGPDADGFLPAREAKRFAVC